MWPKDSEHVRCPECGSRFTVVTEDNKAGCRQCDWTGKKEELSPAYIRRKYAL